MQTVCLELSKYVLAFLMAFYALAAYRGAVIRNEDKRKKDIPDTECYNGNCTFYWLSYNVCCV